MKKTDSHVQQNVIQELTWDTRVDEPGIVVAVDDGVVTLTGTVSSWAKRVAAQEAAHRVDGVLDVANDIEVKIPANSGRTDTEISHATRHALQWDVFVPDAKIRSTVTNGWVTLEGDVDTWMQREDAERVVRNLIGVCGISNKLEVKAPQVDSSWLKRTIEDALQRHAAREAKSIHFDVRDGLVNLSGIVNSWNEKQAVLGAARGTPGVRTVEDNVHVAPHDG